ncbi:hypothetical protein FA95DRAFT_833650 [Auriscalpium vulgare]|uniref:Uncharacterized protein n=1 Tax=Auriscalpium vulgare TaxID=40419 RepID=A0ACB8RZP0_9AGAM|nr:hypothetical protein FA95DRAFT_833650 [Auriscalpium vulgare]
MQDVASHRTGSSGRERSVSGDLDSEVGSPQDGHDQDPPAGKPGRKKNPNSQAARRDQNRIAQREFRLRKQQRIRDLEARVEILSGGKDEALGEMRNILKDLMAENNVLRNLLRSLSGFIGDGAGGLLPKLGWTHNDFENFINRSETDTAFESYQRRKQDGTGVGATTLSGAPATTSSRKRAADDDDASGRLKRPREEPDRSQDSFNALLPLNPGPSGSNLYSSTNRASSQSQDNSLFSDLMRGSNGSPMFNMGPSSPVTPAYGNSSQVPANPAGFQSSYLNPLNMSVDSPMASMSFVGNTAAPVQPQPQPRTNAPVPSNSEDLELLDPKSLEAQKLISYHLDNYKRNSAYCLPASLRPTLVQRTVPHGSHPLTLIGSCSDSSFVAESVIDRIIHPDLRDRLILLRGRFNLVDCLHDYAQGVTLHGDDVLAHTNWEIGETWLRRYGFLIDPNTLNTCNKWRRERGLQELRMVDIAPPEAQSTGV